MLLSSEKWLTCAVLMWCAEVAQSLSRYEQLRAARCTQIVSWSHRIGAVYTSTHPLMMKCRNFLIRHMPEWLAIQRMNVIYGYTPPWTNS